MAGTKDTTGSDGREGSTATTTRKTLACGCEVVAARDFLGRVVGTVMAKGATCTQPLHAPHHVIVMPGREHARPE